MVLYRSKGSWERCRRGRLCKASRLWNVWAASAAGLLGAEGSSSEAGVMSSSERSLTREPAEEVGVRSVSLGCRTELLTAGPQSDSESYDELLNIVYIFKVSDMLLVESVRLRS